MLSKVSTCFNLTKKKTQQQQAYPRRMFHSCIVCLLVFFWGGGGGVRLREPKLMVSWTLLEEGAVHKAFSFAKGREKKSFICLASYAICHTFGCKM